MVSSFRLRQHLLFVGCFSTAGEKQPTEEKKSVQFPATCFSTFCISASNSSDASLPAPPHSTPPAHRPCHPSLAAARSPCRRRGHGARPAPRRGPGNPGRNPGRRTARDQAGDSSATSRWAGMSLAMIAAPAAAPSSRVMPNNSCRDRLTNTSALRYQDMQLGLRHVVEQPQPRAHAQLGRQLLDPRAQRAVADHHQLVLGRQQRQRHQQPVGLLVGFEPADRQDGFAPGRPRLRLRRQQLMRSRHRRARPAAPGRGRSAARTARARPARCRSAGAPAAPSSGRPAGRAGAAPGAAACARRRGSTARAAAAYLRPRRPARPAAPARCGTNARGSARSARRCA